MNHRLSVLWLFGALLAAGVMLSACGGGSTVAEPKPLTPLPAPGYQMTTLWRTGTGNGSGELLAGFSPAVADGRVYVANRDGRVAALDLTDGRRLWRQDTDETFISGPAADGDTLVLGTRDGRVVALSADDGHELWSVKLSSEVIATPAADGSTVVALAGDGLVVALDERTGERRWTVESTVPRLTLRGNASPRINGNVVYVGQDNGKVQALNLDTGEQVWQQTVALPAGRSELDRIVDIDADPVIRGDQMYVVSAGGKLARLSLNGGRIDWKQNVAAETGLAVSADAVYTTDSNSSVWALVRSSGRKLWSIDTFEYRELSAPAIYDGDVLVGDYEGYLHWLSTDDGSEIARGQPFHEAIRAAPVVVGDRAIVLGADGDVAAVRFTAAGG